MLVQEMVQAMRPMPMRMQTTRTTRIRLMLLPLSRRMAQLRILQRTHHTHRQFQVDTRSLQRKTQVLHWDTIRTNQLLRLPRRRRLTLLRRYRTTHNITLRYIIRFLRLFRQRPLVSPQQMFHRPSPLRLRTGRRRATRMILRFRRPNRNARNSSSNTGSSLPLL